MSHIRLWRATRKIKIRNSTFSYWTITVESVITNETAVPRFAQNRLVQIQLQIIIIPNFEETNT